MGTTSRARVEVLWRPGCPFCGRLRRGLRRAGIETVEHDIRSDPSAAARVRRATGGDETVPTVVVGSRTLVNPSVAQVRAALGAEFPDEFPDDPAPPAASGRSSVPPGALWALGVLAVWVLLALWRPTTTWHLAPLLLAAAWPWTAGQDARRGDRAAAVRIAGAGVAGAALAAAATLGLAAAGLLRGPAWGGFGSVVTESSVLGVVGAATAVLLGVPRALRAATTRSAWVGDRRIASSDDVVLVEGNAYFPLSAVEPGVLAASGTRTLCPWKGVARYHSVVVDGTELSDAAWVYPRPLPLARRIRGRVAFEGVVEVRGG